jgi:hypothetical protein
MGLNIIHIIVKILEYPEFDPFGVDMFSYYPYDYLSVYTVSVYQAIILSYSLAVLAVKRKYRKPKRLLGPSRRRWRALSCSVNINLQHPFLYFS